MNSLIVKEAKEFWKDEEGMGTIEMVLIIVVLIGLVAAFRTTISSTLTTILKRINTLQNKIK